MPLFLYFIWWFKFNSLPLWYQKQLTMARKVYVNVTTRLIINLEEGEEIDEVMSDMDYNYNYCPDGAENRVTDTEITEYEVTDVK